MNICNQLRSLLLAGLLLCSIPAQSEELSAVFLHWNDFHSYNTPHVNSEGDTVGGYAYLAGYLDSLKSVHSEPVFTLHAGDDFQGTPISTLTRGASQILLLNRIQPDAFALGNHEFDYGRGRLDTLLQQANFPILAANLTDLRTGKPFVPRTTTLRRGGITVGIIGLTAPDLSELTLPDNVRDLRIIDAPKAVKSLAKELESTVDLTVVLSHMGFHQDSLLAESLGPSSPVDLIVGGHSHTPLRRARRINGIYLTQAGQHGEFLGYIQADVDTERQRFSDFKSQLLPVIPQHAAPNEEVASLVDSLETVARETFNTVIGTLKTAWIRDRHDDSNIGHWLTDVMRDYADADIAFQNSGGIRKDLQAGPIRIREIWEICPFGNHFVRFSITGAQLQRLVRHQIRSPQEFLQVSGLRYRYLPGARRPEGISVNGKDIEKGRQYTIVTNNYVFSHFEEFFGLPVTSASGIRHLNVLDREVFIQAVRKQGTITTQTDDRVQVLE